MKVLRRIAMAIGVTVVIALVIGLAAPKGVRAVVSTLVTVTNTSSNPVPVQSVDDHALHAFQQAAHCTISSARDCLAQGLFPVPLGMTAVVQDVSGLCNFNPLPGTSGFAPPPTIVFLEADNSAATVPSLDNSSGETADVNLPAVLQGTFGLLNTFYTFGRPTTLYAASPSAGPQATFTFFVQPPSTFNGTCSVNISGYYVKNGQ